MNLQKTQEVTPMVSWNSKAKLLLMPVLVAVVFSLLACGAGYRTVIVNGEKKVYKVDEEGNRTLVYQVHKDGTTVVHDEKDPMYQQHRAEERRVEEGKKAEVARLERIKHAPKRRAGAPIYVALHATELGESMKKDPQGVHIGQGHKAGEPEGPRAGGTGPAGASPCRQESELITRGGR
jgi:hypothetical protein